MSNSRLSSGWVYAHQSNYIKGRQVPISRITYHHMAGKLTADQCGGIFARAGRNGSAHYGIGYSGEIKQYVDESDTAWSDSNWYSNQRTVSIETANDQIGGGWHVPDQALSSLIRLIADIAKRNNLGKLVLGQNLFYHSMVGQTECPGPYLRGKAQYICDEANKINYSPVSKPTIDLIKSNADIEYRAITPKKVRLVRDTNLWNFNFTKWGEAKAIRGYVVGEIIDVVAIAHNKTVNASYYMTVYSYNNGNIKSTNGFNIKDCEDLNPEEPEPKVEPTPELRPIEPTPPKPNEAPLAPDNDNKPPRENKNDDETKTPLDKGEMESKDYPEENNALLKKIVELLSWLVDKFKNIFK